MKHAGLLLAACTAIRIFPGCHAGTESPRAPEKVTQQGDAGAGAIDGSSPTALDAPRIFLGEIAIEKRLKGRIDGKTAFKLVVRASPGQSPLSELARRGVHYTQRQGFGELLLRGYPAAHDRPTQRDRRASFVIDYDTDEVQSLRGQLRRELGQRPTMKDVAGFVSRFIVTKDLAREYDPASVVARRREGDCSEHAVLLAALGRAVGFATRVIHGVVIIDRDDHIEAEGHAWVEWADGSGWLPADAAVPAELGPIYLPLQVLKDESPAYGRNLLLGMPFALGPLVVEAP